MIRVLDDLPANIVGFEAVGLVDAGDYQSVVEPAIDSALTKHDTIRLLYVLGPDFDGFSGGAMWEDAKAGMAHWSKWDRIAVVTDHGAIADGIKFFGWMVPGDVKLFTLASVDDATAWLTE
ncbi:MAG TPA: STAS/SEC14 domain-containing protein [Acidimicrobiia bacterium]|nr:STAS/SEC14 domain-containing protein [Acidimicrobiia bacterium]